MLWTFSSICFLATHKSVTYRTMNEIFCSSFVYCLGVGPDCVGELGDDVSYDWIFFQENYFCDSWLGLIMQDKLWFDFSVERKYLYLFLVASVNAARFASQEGIVSLLIRFLILIRSTVGQNFHNILGELWSIVLFGSTILFGWWDNDESPSNVFSLP